MAEPKSRAELDAVKNQKFRALARHAHAHAPYYANIVRERAIDLNTCTLNARTRKFQLIVTRNAGDA